jgi:hypothetical protein
MPQKVLTTVKGGDKLARVLGDLGRRMGNGTVNIGFLSGARYPDSVKGADALIKGLNKLNAVGPQKPGAKPRTTLTGPQQVQRGIPVAQAAFWDEFGTATSKPRPFMRQTVAQKSPQWGDKMARLAVKTKYNGPLVLKLMGDGVKDQIVTAIKQWPPDNAPLTVAIKGFNKGLVHQGIMQRSVDYEVKGT